MQLLEMLFYRLPLEEVELFVVQAWLLWTQRNKVKTGGMIQDPNQLVKRASVFLEEYRASQFTGTPCCSGRGREELEMGAAF